MARRKTITLTLPVNRVEGDLELMIKVRDGVVIDAWSRGMMYRGFENMLKGRAPKDSLVLTPRVCGICGTAHLTAAAKALDMVCGVTIPDNALLVRNLASMAEHLQSDMRHGLLMFMPDFANQRYAQSSFFNEAVERYRPLNGRSAIGAIKQTKRIIEIVAIIGGQWPNSSYMVPGGVAGIMTRDDLISCRYLISRFRAWYEEAVLGCPIERWQAVSDSGELAHWYEEAEQHRAGEIGFFLRCCRESGLDQLGRGHHRFISFGQFGCPKTDRQPAGSMVFPPGFCDGESFEPFNQENITEHVTHSRFRDYLGGLHPFNGETIPLSGEPDDHKYSLTKAPRYRDKPAETGPLAEMLCSGTPLFRDLLKTDGASVMTRQLARLARGAVIIPVMERWLAAIDPDQPFYTSVKAIPDGRGYGLTGGCRGALGHWVTIENEAISRYQIITPTAWNGSPRDTNHVRGPWEEAVIGTPVEDPENPVQVAQVIRSFDACQVCSVHCLKRT
ncbi:MAG: nickel-dependent hydrogenase large subunit [Desulfofustis sp.]|nr:nickel-dependent hydrogenase large subunit [Desulfofustis sp.]